MELAACCKQCDWTYVRTADNVSYCAWSCAVHGQMVKAWLSTDVMGEVMTREQFERAYNALRIGA